VTSRSDGGVDTDAEVAPVAEADYVHALSSAEAEQATRCCLQAGLSGVDDGYEAHVELGERAWLPAPDSGAVYDPKIGGQCVAAYAHAECALAKNALEGHVPAVCGRVYARGHRRLGEACNVNQDCEQPVGKVTVCALGQVVDKKAVRVCKELKEAAEGAPCLASDDAVVFQCQKALLCDDKQNRCVRPAARGGACLTGATWGDTCEQGSVCDRAGSKRCVAPAAVGTACSYDNLCEGFACMGNECREPLFEILGAGICKP
jgi:hypothetical protein